jgi:hypothetical protein
MEFIQNSSKILEGRPKDGFGWLVRLFNDILTTGKLIKLFKQAKIIAILKPGKDGTDASHNRPISTECRLQNTTTYPTID